MTENDDFKTSLLTARWRLFRTVTVESTSGPVQLDIRIPPPNVLKDLLTKLKASKEEAAGDDGAALDMVCEVSSKCVWRPGAVRHLFSPAEIADWPFLSAVQGDCFEALRAASSVETARGNSETTRT
jgi:hypothetical protein